MNNIIRTPKQVYAAERSHHLCNQKIPTVCHLNRIKSVSVKPKAFNFQRLFSTFFRPATNADRRPIGFFAMPNL